jgi:hypothetical protein
VRQDIILLLVSKDASKISRRHQKKRVKLNSKIKFPETVENNKLT